MRELAFDGVGIEPPAFVEQRRRHRAKTVRGHFLLSEAERAQGGVDRVFGHRPLIAAKRRETISAGAGELPKLLEHADHLAGERHAVRPPHLHLLRREAPDRALEVEFRPFGLPQFAGPHE